MRLRGCLEVSKAAKECFGVCAHHEFCRQGYCSSAGIATVERVDLFVLFCSVFCDEADLSVFARSWNICGLLAIQVAHQEWR